MFSGVEGLLLHDLVDILLVRAHLAVATRGVPLGLLVESLSSSINKDKKSVVLSYGQRLCDFGQRLLEAEPCFLPLKTKFKFSEKLSSVKSEVSAILSNQTKGTKSLNK